MLLLFHVTCLIKKLNFITGIRCETGDLFLTCRYDGSLFKYLKDHLEGSLKNKDITHNMSSPKLGVH